MIRTIKGRKISKGVAEGQALVTSDPISFLGDINPKSGTIVEPNHELYGSCIAGKILVFPMGKGSTVGSYVLYQLTKNGLAPAAIINKYSEPIVAVGAIISGIPLVDCLKEDPTKSIETGDKVLVNGTEGYVEVESCRTK
jgi:predicted aconitase with swiveling domain